MKNIIYCFFLFLGYMLITSKAITAQNTHDVTSWDILAKVTWIVDQETQLYSANFDQEVEKLDEQEVTIKGYLFPLGYGVQSSEFLLTPYPISGCFYCVPGSSETMIHLPEVKIKEIPYSEVSIKGKFRLVRDNSYGLIYEMKDVSVSIEEE